MRFARHYKDTIEEKMAILISFCHKFIGVISTRAPKLSK